MVPALVFSDRFGQLAWRPAYWREWTGTSWERIRLYMFGDDPGPLDP